MSIYLDCNATTPMEIEVLDTINNYFINDFGNAGSRTHEYGSKAKSAVQTARQQVAALLPDVDASDVIFTSGATESNNIAILGLQEWAQKTKRRHIVATSIEHKAVIEPLKHLESKGYEVDWITSRENGAVCSSEVLSKVREDTLLVSVMHVNNETGVIQPIEDIAEGLSETACIMHVDAAQGYGKEITQLRNKRIDLISISGHKIYGPKGIGALIMRRRNFKRAPLTPVFFGGGQERGLRPGTLPVPLIAGFGVAANLCGRDHDARAEKNRQFRETLLSSFQGLNFRINGNLSLSIPNTLNLSFPGIDSEALMIALKEKIAISNGSACNSNNYEPSHVLLEMGLEDEIVSSSIRISWCHMTPEPDWDLVQHIILSLR